MKKSTLLLILILSAALVPALLMTGCQKSEEETETTEESEVSQVKILGPFQAGEATKFENTTIALFEEKNPDIDIVYEATGEFEALINVRVEAGDPPDIAAVPQPGLMNKFAEAEELVELWSKVLSIMEDNYAMVWKDLGSYEGKPYGIFHRVNTKSNVFYPKKAWNEAGYPIPKTWDELIALSDRMVNEGRVPWTITIESQAATGWVATDWMEDIMLRTAGPEVYDQWISHEIPFNHETVKRAAELMTDVWLTDGYVLGGTTTILTTNYRRAGDALVTDPPQAWMLRQGSFALDFLPEEVRSNLDEEIGVFPFPEIDSEWGTPVLGGGDQYVLFKKGDSPSARTFMEFLPTWDSAKGWAAAGGALFPHKSQDTSVYPTELEQNLAKAIVEAEVFRFDASDSMPAAVGNGSFWTGMVDLVSGVPIDQVLDEIEKSWPEE